MTKTCRVAALLCAGLVAAGSPMAASEAAAKPAALRAESLLSAASLEADVALLRRAFETLHPGLLRYNTPAQLDQAFRDLAAELGGDRTLAEAFLAFSRFTAKMRCGHTYVSFFNQSDAVSDALFETPRLPFYFRWLGERMVVTRSFAEDARLRPGTEILALDGVPVVTILARLLTVARDLPLIGQFADGDRPDAGLEPDVLVVPTIEDIAAGRDAELKAVRARLRPPG